MYKTHQRLRTGLWFLSMILMAREVFCWEGGIVSNYSPLVIREALGVFGGGCIFIYITLYALNTVTVFPPIIVLSLSAGFLFGPARGALAVLAGAFIGTSLTFYLSKHFGRNILARWNSRRVFAFRKKLKAKGFKAVLFIRAFPILPWEIVNYTSGVSGISYRDYILATLLGLLPSAILRSYFADKIAVINPGSPQWLAALFFIAVVVLAPSCYLFANRKYRHVLARNRRLK